MVVLFLFVLLLLLLLVLIFVRKNKYPRGVVGSSESWNITSGLQTAISYPRYVAPGKKITLQGLRVRVTDCRRYASSWEAIQQEGYKNLVPEANSASEALSKIVGPYVVHFSLD